MFDLKLNGPGSKYLLTQFYFPSNTGRIPSFITQVVNISTFPVKSSFNLEGSFAAVLRYESHNWSSGVGIDIWGRSKEKLRIDAYNLIKENSANLNDFAILGRQISENSVGTIEDSYYCEPLARINKSESRRTIPNMYNNKIKDARFAQNRIPANFSEALDFESTAEQRAISGKITGHVGYIWKHHRFCPNIKFFGAIEITKYGDKQVNLWSIGLQNSLHF